MNATLHMCVYTLFCFVVQSSHFGMWPTKTWWGKKKKLANYYKNINVSNVLAVLTLCEKCVCARARHSCHIFIECALCADFNYFQCCFKSQCHCWCFKQGMLQYVCMPVWPLKLHQSSFLHNYYC